MALTLTGRVCCGCGVTYKRDVVVGEHDDVAWPCAPTASATAVLVDVLVKEADRGDSKPVERTVKWAGNLLRWGSVRPPRRGSHRAVSWAADREDRRGLRCSAWKRVDHGNAPSACERGRCPGRGPPSGPGPYPCPPESPPSPDVAAAWAAFAAPAAVPLRTYCVAYTRDVTAASVCYSVCIRLLMLDVNIGSVAVAGSTWMTAAGSIGAVMTASYTVAAQIVSTAVSQPRPWSPQVGSRPASHASAPSTSSARIGGLLRRASPQSGRSRDVQAILCYIGHNSRETSRDARGQIHLTGPLPVLTSNISGRIQT